MRYAIQSSIIRAPLQPVKETFERRRALPAFRIDLADLEVLCVKLRKQFPEKHDFTVYLKLGTRTLYASGVDELRTAPELPKTAYHFYIQLQSWEPHRNCTIYAYQQQFGQPRVLVEADDETWCAGMVDLVQTFTRNHRRWYSALRGWPLTIMALVVPNVFNVINWIVNFSESISLAAVAPMFMFLVLWIARPYLFPAGTLAIRSEESVWKRHVPELSLLVAIISLVATAAQIVIALRGEPTTLQKPQAQPTTPAPVEAAPPKAPASKPAS